MKTLVFKIVTPERIVLEREVTQATLPVEGGEVTVLPEHMPYIGALKVGAVTVKDADGAEEDLAVSGGFVEFHDDTLTVLADTAERSEEIDIERAEAARARAERQKGDRERMDDEEYARVAGQLEKELARLKVAARRGSGHMPRFGS